MFFTIFGILWNIQLIFASEYCEAGWSFCSTKFDSICPKDYIRIKASCFHLYTGGKSFTAADQLCKSDGAVLAGSNLEDDTTVSTLKTTFSLDSSRNYWIGSHASSDEQTFVWLNNEATVSDGIEKFISADTDDSCVKAQIADNIKMFSTDCTSELDFVCEIEIKDDCTDGNGKLNECSINLECKSKEMKISIHGAVDNFTISAINKDNVTCPTISEADSDGIFTVTSSYENCLKDSTGSNGGINLIISHHAGNFITKGDLDTVFQCNTTVGESELGLTNTLTISLYEHEFDHTEEYSAKTSMTFIDENGDTLKDDRVELGSKMCVSITFVTTNELQYIAFNNLYAFSPNGLAEDTSSYVKIMSNGCLEKNRWSITNPGYVSDCSAKEPAGSCKHVATKCLKAFKFTDSDEILFKAQLLLMLYQDDAFAGSICAKRKKRLSISMGTIFAEKRITVFVKTPKDNTDNSGKKISLNFVWSIICILLHPLLKPF